MPTIQASADAGAQKWRTSVCGISGKMMFDRSATVPAGFIRSMLSPMAHRGPDDEGVYVAPQVGLGHRRLSIIGLGSGHQPLSNEDGTVWITFNGEIYNYQDLRRQLIARGHQFKTDTDTEVIIHLYEDYGPACVSMLRGMFAFGIWDERSRQLFLARDRVGIKPLYYALNANAITFASEIKALLVDEDLDTTLDPHAIDRFLAFNYLPGEDTLLRNVKKLSPGCSLLAQGAKIEIKQYWDLQFGGSTMNLAEAEQRVEEMLEESIRLHLISDVPVGVLLSGGVDSTAVLSMATAASEHPLSTYTIGFGEKGLPDERPFARLAAERFGTEHHEITITSKDFQDFLPKFVWHMEEPVCEPPAVALYYVSKLASQFVKVLLSGEGGDEAFAGYPEYRNTLWLERAKAALGPLAPTASRLLQSAGNLLNSERAAKYSVLMRTPLESYYYSRTTGPHSVFNRDRQQFYSNDFAAATEPNLSLEPVARLWPNVRQADLVNRMLYVDTKTWLPDDLLIKADKITMANSVELRVPLLDHELLELAASLPGRYKVRGRSTKYLAKRALRRHVPSEILNRKKAGFPVPYHSWIQSEMSGWVRDVLLDGNAHTRAYFRQPQMERLIRANEQTGKHAKELFSLTVLELWHRAFTAKVPETVMN